MNFTVIGASGFIGSNLVQSLRKDGHTVLAPERGESLAGRALDHVIYCAGVTADFRSRPFDAMRAHASALADVLEQASFHSLLYLSSTRVYAHIDAQGAASEEAALPVHPADPSDLYNISKLAGESLCRCSGRSNVRVVRLSNVIGFDPVSENFLLSLIRQAIAGRIELQSDPRSAKDYVLLDDVVSVLPRIALQGRDWIYNVAGGINLSHQALLDRLATLTGCEVVVRPDAPLTTFPRIDIRRIESEFDFHPASVLDALPTLVDAYRRHTAAA